jgi:hypothetical protein
MAVCDWGVNISAPPGKTHAVLEAGVTPYPPLLPCSTPSYVGASGQTALNDAPKVMSSTGVYEVRSRDSDASHVSKIDVTAIGTLSASGIT